MEEEHINRMQLIVQDYFNDILHLPCPDFTCNYRQLHPMCPHQIKVDFKCEQCGKVVFGDEVLN